MEAKDIIPFIRSRQIESMRGNHASTKITVVNDWLVRTDFEFYPLVDSIDVTYYNSDFSVDYTEQITTDRQFKVEFYGLVEEERLAIRELGESLDQYKKEGQEELQAIREKAIDLINQGLLDDFLSELLD